MIAPTPDSAATDSVSAALSALAASVGQVPPTLVMQALDDPENGVVIFDADLRILHATSQVPRLIGLETSCSDGPQDLLEMLSNSALDQCSMEGAKELVSSTAVSPNALVLLDRDRSRQLRMTVREIGSQHRVVSFYAVVSPDSTEPVTEFAIRDSLTGLASRSFFENAVAHAMAHGGNEPLAVLLVDLDRFKAVNDTLGHSAGDSLLRLVAERMKSLVRNTDIVARLGGDEFAILQQPSLGVESAKAVGDRILDLVQRTYLIEGQLVNVGTSIGIARFPDDATDCKTLLKFADLALYHSKTSGRASYHFFETFMEKRAQARRLNELELRRALALRQLEVFYQPQVDITGNTLVGFEALIRWRHPERGLISPADFLPIAEEIGVIVPIGEWVLRTACREAMNWPSHVTIAVNASPLQFGTGTFAECVRRALKATGLPGERLEIEVTEGIMLRNNDVVVKTLNDLRSMNVRIAMDDFGTGYASLSQLARFPFDKIKIDRSLAGFEGDNPKQRAIVRAISALGQSLGVCTLAEGVETADQLNRLHADGCDSVQGYFLSKPVPTDQLPNILARFSDSPQHSE